METIMHSEGDESESKRYMHLDPVPFIGPWHDTLSADDLQGMLGERM